jgi:predicted ATP-dependent serine protease
MAKEPAAIYVCKNCGRQERKSSGRCADYGEYSSFVEEKFRRRPQAKGINSPNVRIFPSSARIFEP